MTMETSRATAAETTRPIAGTLDGGLAAQGVLPWFAGEARPASLGPVGPAAGPPGVGGMAAPRPAPPFGLGGLPTFVEENPPLNLFQWRSPPICCWVAWRQFLALPVLEMGQAVRVWGVGSPPTFV
jgi:hypothetical protein